MSRYDYLTINKRDADCYDVTDGDRRVAALRSAFTEDEKGKRTMIPGTWCIRWEGPDFRQDAGRIVLEALRFNTVHEAFAFFCGQCLK
ncbi:hypothetical protein HOU00_gp316 [Caulobacter phage CcrPW]|uniref:Uncharacterized protein n=1 Tax=Caulobacter phage CcrPW TaxID=2283271 RepID=A0A385EDN1_9CAUD|nr:hypothetical protein HOU00_gp316 [Caulobacter phage CcrPW]AXQ68809.1 hypothetical protein CcrPW_gp270 [Caulobacter phage CcrPW]